MIKLSNADWEKLRALFGELRGTEKCSTPEDLDHFLQRAWQLQREKGKTIDPPSIKKRLDRLLEKPSSQSCHEFTARICYEALTEEGRRYLGENHRWATLVKHPEQSQANSTWRQSAADLVTRFNGHLAAAVKAQAVQAKSIEKNPLARQNFVQAFELLSADMKDVFKDLDGFMLPRKYDREWAQEGLVFDRSANAEKPVFHVVILRQTRDVLTGFRDKLRAFRIKGIRMKNPGSDSLEDWVESVTKFIAEKYRSENKGPAFASLKKAISDGIDDMHLSYLFHPSGQGLASLPYFALKDCASKPNQEPLQYEKDGAFLSRYSLIRFELCKSDDAHSGYTIQRIDFFERQ